MNEEQIVEFRSQVEDFFKSFSDLLVEKQIAYGNSFERSAEILEILFPEGVHVSKYRDMLAIVRVLDKFSRIATKKDAFGENPWEDIVGYATLSSLKDKS